VAIDEETLERLRRGFELRLSATGAFSFPDGPVTHDRVREALRAGLDVTPEGEPIVRLGPQWAYINVDDCVLRATGVDAGDGDTLEITLDDGRRVPLHPETLWEEPGAGLRCTVPSQPTGSPLSVRFTNAAQMQLAAWIEDVDGTATLHVGDSAWPIAQTAPSPSS
jgi:hypothetical protein